METDENEIQARSRSASRNTEALSNENQEEAQVARNIRKIKPRKINEEHSTLIKFAKVAPVAERATGETIIITRNGDEVAEVAAYTPSWFYGGYHTLVAPGIFTTCVVMNDISILVLKTQELNPSPQKADQTLQTSPGPANPLNHRLEPVNYSTFRRPTTEDLIT
ncbi:hypothetical protein DSO57_1004672 [Entomophthora muscae]|uniref:Uncharacterized protein n=1 Tax=Entomophthora muscae TaxID=34485 RepID=A0ACC2U686_9FUNG|nr:hypothetical protein DSO57_1004672 [Entomophthora muscae]